MIYLFLFLMSTTFYENIDVCGVQSEFKSYMDYNAITNTKSLQGQLKATVSEIDENGIYTLNGRKLVAMGQKSLGIGDYVDITLDSGETLEVIIGDIKHEGCNSGDGSQIEFIVDTKNMNKEVKLMGNFNIIYKGVIKEMRKNLYKNFELYKEDITLIQSIKEIQKEYYSVQDLINWKMIEENRVKIIEDFFEWKE